MNERNDDLLQDVTQQPLAKGVTIMSGTTDVVKGRIKEAAGALTGDDKLREAGKSDQVAGKVKQAEVAQKAAHEAKVAAEKAKDDTDQCVTECE